MSPPRPFGPSQRFKTTKVALQAMQISSPGRMFNLAGSSKTIDRRARFPKSDFSGAGPEKNDQ